ncbi:MAG: hypothetical protein SFV32_12670 [Opitutaceae bacterium]|nr:hypothetical protein [Opitutaceae bacterium]
MSEDKSSTPPVPTPLTDGLHELLCTCDGAGSERKKAALEHILKSIGLLQEKNAALETQLAAAQARVAELEALRDEHQRQDEKTHAELNKLRGYYTEIVREIGHDNVLRVVREQQTRLAAFEAPVEEEQLQAAAKYLLCSAEQWAALSRDERESICAVVCKPEHKYAEDHRIYAAETLARAYRQLRVERDELTRKLKYEEKICSDVIRERDYREDVINRLCDAAGHKFCKDFEWTSHYGFEDAIRDVEDKVDGMREKLAAFEALPGDEEMQKAWESWNALGYGAYVQEKASWVAGWLSLREILAARAPKPSEPSAEKGGES